MLRDELRVFLSSTFRDLQSERAHLLNKIFPELRHECRTRGVEFTEVDLPVLPRLNGAPLSLSGYSENAMAGCLRGQI
jgi:aspartate oxidase